MRNCTFLWYSCLFMIVEDTKRLLVAFPLCFVPLVSHITSPGKRKLLTEEFAFVLLCDKLWILLRRHTEGNIVIYRKRKWRLGTHSCACPIFLMLMWHNRSHLQHQANKQTLWLRSGMISRLYSVFCWTGCCLKVIISCRLRITVSFKTAENNDFQIRPAWFFFSYWISLWVYYWLTEWSASIKSLLLCVKCLSGCSLCIKATL